MLEIRTMELLSDFTQLLYVLLLFAYSTPSQTQSIWKLFKKRSPFTDSEAKRPGRQDVRRDLISVANKLPILYEQQSQSRLSNPQVLGFKISQFSLRTA